MSRPSALVLTVSMLAACDGAWRGRAPDPHPFTLSASGLQTLDWYGGARCRDGSCGEPPKVRALRAMADGSVALDVEVEQCGKFRAPLFYTSSDEGGSRALAGIPIGEFDRFGLAVSLVAVNGEPPAADDEALAGAYLDGAEQPVSVGPGAGQRRVSWVGIRKSDRDGQPLDPAISDIGVLVAGFSGSKQRCDAPAMITLGIAPVLDAVQIGPERRPPRRAFTVGDESLKRLEAVGPDHAALEIQDPPGPGVRLRLAFTGSPLTLRFDEITAAQFRRLEGFDRFELLCTLEAARGRDGGPPPIPVVCGAKVNEAYRPKMLAPGATRRSGISSTQFTGSVSDVAVTLYPLAYSPAGGSRSVTGEVTMLIASAPGAEVVP